MAYPKGKPKSEESKRKVSETLKRIGHKPPSNHKVWNKGLKHSDEAREKMRQMATGRKLTEATKEKIRNKLSILRSGELNTMYGRKAENSPRWKGGITTLRARIYNSREYKKWRTDIFSRDFFTCVFCNKIGGKLNSDHIKPYSFIIKKYKLKTFDEALLCYELWDINNGRTLCLDCHKKTDTYMCKANNYKQ